MTIQRAVVSGTMLDQVVTRSMFTCDVVESGGDTAELLWDAYLASMYDEWMNLVPEITQTTGYELQEYDAGQWVPFYSVPWPNGGTLSGSSIVNAVSLVLIGKAAGLRHMGRKFISGLAGLVLDGNSLGEDYLSTAAAALVAYITPFTGIGGGTITPGVVDKLGVFHPFVGGLVSSILGSMRRRKPGIGM